MFGQSYSYERQAKLLADGDYNVVLEKPYEKDVKGYNVLRFPFIVEGEIEPCLPNYFDLFDCSDPNDPEKVMLFNKQASRIKACFKLDGNFDEHNYLRWTGRKGKIRIEKGENGFTNVVRFYKAEMTEQEERTL